MHTLELGDAGPHSIQGDIHQQLVTGLDRALEARAINPGKVVDRLFIRHHAQGVEGQQGRRLRHGLEHQHARHDGPVRKVPFEEGLVDGDVLERQDALALLQLEHTVNQQKGVAVREAA
jgi:hypothetical protein